MNIPVERIVAVCAALVTFGIGYNALVEWLNREVPDHGYTSFLVVGGVIVTLTGSAFLIGWQEALLVGLCFTASGLPMIAGSVWRSLRQRARERAVSAQEALGTLRGES
ncbi:MAG: hypothetical protein J7M34_05785 [Anaerolineae bacterium]|nr:hypothetical protein [Anaerolineae bacterium]